MSLLSSTRRALRERRQRHQDVQSPPSSATSRSSSSAGANDSSQGDIRQGSERETGEVTVTPYRDGPYLLRGPFNLRDQDGVEIDNARRVIALCRCGKSRTRPFCDGTHRLIDFRAPSGSENGLESSPEKESENGG